MSATEESVLLLNIQLSAESSTDTSELSELVVAAGLIVVGEILSKRTAPDSKFYVGKGKAEEVALFVKEKSCSTRKRKFVPKGLSLTTNCSRLSQANCSLSLLLSLCINKQ